MQLRRFQIQYYHERRRIIGMMEAGWSPRQVSRQLGHFDCAVRRCWDLHFHLYEDQAQDVFVRPVVEKTAPS
ncbi:hypothetical protein TNCV_2407711 [Trichonephila clavipes]|nr:hypothetical protein TNCV_2407711 [Trichonephila clavipes]